MNFEWDENKRLSNLEKHGIDFIDAPIIFKGYTLTVEDDRFDYGEQRFITIGILNERVVVVIHTEKKDFIRIISIRKASKYERKNYFATIPN